MNLVVTFQRQALIVSKVIFHAWILLCLVLYTL